MNAAHLHLIINHIPVYGFMFGLVFYLVALIKGKDILIKAALWIFLLVALSAVPGYLTGDPAAEFIGNISGISQETVHEHEETAEVAFVSALVIGLLSLMGLINYHRRRKLSKLYLVFMLLVAVVVASLMASAANLGGEIRHPEIRPEFSPPATIEQESTPLDTAQSSMDETDPESDSLEF